MAPAAAAPEALCAHVHMEAGKERLELGVRRCVTLGTCATFEG
jgi:hypothetical protein